MTNATQRDYYDVHGALREADAQTIKHAFRRLAMEWYPDRSNHSKTTERFQEIAEAYAVLCDPGKRAAYHARGHCGVTGYSMEDLYGGIDLDDLLGGLGFGFEGTLFDHLFRRRSQGPAKGAHLERESLLPLERIARGGEETIHLARPAVCGDCHGSGAAPGTTPHCCAAFGGTGRKVTTQRREGVLLQQVTTCPQCHGKGQTIEMPCPACHGSGRVQRDETLRVRIPPGVEEGMTLRLAGHGLPPPGGRGDAPGDLHLMIHSKPDPRFKHIGADLWYTDTVSVADAVLGTTRIVPTLNGSVRIQVPPGMQPDTVLRVSGKGMPHFGRREHGDLCVWIRVHIPQHLTPEERELYEHMRSLKTASGARRCTGQA